MIRSDEYLEKVESGAQYFIGNPENRLGDIIHIAGEPKLLLLQRARQPLVSEVLGTYVRLRPSRSPSAAQPATRSRRPRSDKKGTVTATPARW